MEIVLFILGAAIGSFLNVCIDRLPEGQDIVFKKSHCDYCKRTLRWYELVPIISWLILRGRSRCCQKTLSFQYPLIETVTGIGFVVMYLVTIPVLSSIRFIPLISSIILLASSYIVFCSLLVIFATDLKDEIIPLPFLLTGCIGAVIRLLILESNSLQSGLQVSNIVFFYIIPSFVCAAGFFLLWFITKGRAMGDGDMFLVFLLGLVTGYPLIILTLYIAFLTGAIIGIMLILVRKKTLKSHISFGPFLILAELIVLIVGNQVIFTWRMLW